MLQRNTHWHSQYVENGCSSSEDQTVRLFAVWHLLTLRCTPLQVWQSERQIYLQTEVLHTDPAS